MIKCARALAILGITDIGCRWFFFPTCLVFVVLSFSTCFVCFGAYVFAVMFPSVWYQVCINASHVWWQEENLLVSKHSNGASPVVDLNWQRGTRFQTIAVWRRVQKKNLTPSNTRISFWIFYGTTILSIQILFGYLLIIQQPFPKKKTYGILYGCLAVCIPANGRYKKTYGIPWWICKSNSKSQSLCIPHDPSEDMKGITLKKASAAARRIVPWSVLVSSQFV